MSEFSFALKHPLIRLIIPNGHIESDHPTISTETGLGMTDIQKAEQRYTLHTYAWKTLNNTQYVNPTSDMCM